MKFFCTEDNIFTREASRLIFGKLTLGASDCLKNSTKNLDEICKLRFKFCSSKHVDFFAAGTKEKYYCHSIIFHELSECRAWVTSGSFPGGEREARALKAWANKHYQIEKGKSEMGGEF